MTKAEAKGGDVQIKAGLIWMNGAFVPQEEAKTSVLSHALHYGTSVFAVSYTHLTLPTIYSV